MIRPIDIRLNAAHPDYPLAEAVTFTGSPSTVLIRGVPPNCGRWAITAVSVAATFPDGSTTTRAAVQSANGVWVATLPATATSGRTANGIRVMADGIDENGEAITGYVLGVADFAVASLDVTPAPQPGETSWQMLYFDTTPATPRKGDVIRADGDLKFYNGEAWLPFTDLSDYYTAEQVDEAIDKLAAYYITYNAAGAAFPTRADLLNAQTYYSGGVERTPTRNDYAVVLADETHDGAEWRYIYAVPDGQTAGQWEAQYPIETNDYDALANKPQINGNALTGNKTGAALGLLDASNGVASGLIVAFGNYGIRWDSRSSTEYTLELVYRPNASSSWAIIRTFYIPQATTGNLALVEQIISKAIEAIAPEFSILYSYSVGQLVRKDGILYICTTAHPSATPWDPSHFQANATVESALAVIRAAIPTASTSTPRMDGEGSAGSSAAFARGDHRHPSDSAKLDKSGGTMTGSLTLYEPQNGAEIYFPSGGKAKLQFGSGLLNVDDTTGRVTINQKDAAVVDNIPYALITKTVTNGAVSLDDRAINAVAVSSSLASLTINFPTATSGKARDFGLRLTVASGITTAPELALPQGVVCENADGEAPEIGADGAATILYFTETASGVFLVKGEVLQTITQA